LFSADLRTPKKSEKYILILCWVGLPFRIMSKYAC
jgi:hypothetical protein